MKKGVNEQPELGPLCLPGAAHPGVPPVIVLRKSYQLETSGWETSDNWYPVRVPRIAGSMVLVTTMHRGGRERLCQHQCAEV